MTQPATSAAALAIKAMHGSRRRQGNRDAMGWLFLEVLVALVIAVAIVAWTMGPKRKRSRGEFTDDAGRGDKR
jgi:hypothetical protein